VSNGRRLLSIEVEGNDRGLICVSEENSDSPQVRRCSGRKSNTDRAECEENEKINKIERKI
jgi:hypothetical protein